MELVSLEWEQRRHFDEVRDLWRTFGPLLQTRHQFAGGVTWKQVKGYEYLARFRTDPITHAKKFEYLGKRKPETEQIYAEFQQHRSDLDGQIAALQRRMDVAARVSKALRIGRMPTQAADALRAIWRAGLDKDVVVVGSSNIYAYELLTGLLVPREAAPSEDLHLMSIVPRSEEAADDLKRALVTADRSYRFSSPSSEFIANDGFRISLVARHKLVDSFFGAHHEAIDREAVTWSIEAPTVSEITLGRDGQPTTATFLDPRAFLVLTACSVRMKRSHGLQTKAHIAAVAEMVAREWPEPFPEQFIELSPVLEEAFGGMRSPAM
jgi:hypothetical protein